MLDKNDKKEFALIVGQVIDKKVTPRLERLEKKSNATMEMVAKNTEDIEMIKDNVSGLKKDMKIVKEDTSELNDTTYRIETKLNAEVIRHDKLSVKVDKIDGRVLKLETKKF